MADLHLVVPEMKENLSGEQEKILARFFGTQKVVVYHDDDIQHILSSSDMLAAIIRSHPAGDVFYIECDDGLPDLKGGLRLRGLSFREAIWLKERHDGTGRTRADSPAVCPPGWKLSLTTRERLSQDATRAVIAPRR